MQSWLFLLAAIVFEVMGTTSMKLSQGFTKTIPSLCMFMFYILCFIFLTYAIKGIEVGVAYAIWSGLGTALIALIGIFYFKDSVNLTKILSLLLIIIGVIGLNLSGKG